MAHWFQPMGQQVGARVVIFLFVLIIFSFTLICFYFSLDGEDSDRSHTASRICSPIQSEEEMVSEDMTDKGDETSDLSKYSLLISSLLSPLCGVFVLIYHLLRWRWSAGIQLLCHQSV